MYPFSEAAQGKGHFSRIPGQKKMVDCLPKKVKTDDDCYNLTAGTKSISGGAGVTIALELAIWSLTIDL